MFLICLDLSAINYGFLTANIIGCYDNKMQRLAARGGYNSIRRNLIIHKGLCGDKKNRESL